MRLLNGFAAISLVLYPGYIWIRGRSISIHIFGHLLLLVLFVLVYLIFSVGQFQLLFLSFEFDLFLSGIFETMMTNLHHIAAYYFFLVFICASKDYYNDKTKAVTKRELLEKELTETRYRVLQRQLQPHFLFNTLNGAISIMEDKKESAQNMLVDLSELLRNSLEIDFGNLISLEREIELLKTYLNIEKKRFEHQLEFEINVPKELSEERVLPFLLQPLAENAIKHGYKGGTKALKVQVEAVREERRIKIEISNNGAPLSVERVGIGRRNTEERLRTTYGEDYSFSLIQKNGKVINRIEFPSI
ncbi:MAG: histidine kinase [Balneolaceae bacterium]|nr:histidine kinase [Balneolaceae bacterium]MBO6545045.1 histidine kinase [Balneolaceae bacterium]MBO6646441.1 histidine kinase [Balneolaceae bacterium]